MIVIGLNRQLPERYVAEPQVHPGWSIEIDVATYEEVEVGSPSTGERVNGGGVATAVWAPPRPTLAVASDLPDVGEYEVRVYDTKRGHRLVAAIEIVSPANKDRPEHRRALRRQMRHVASEPRLCRDRRSGHDPQLQPVQ